MTMPELDHNVMEPFERTVQLARAIAVLASPVGISFSTDEMDSSMLGPRALRPVPCHNS